MKDELKQRIEAWETDKRIVGWVGERRDFIDALIAALKEADGVAEALAWLPEEADEAHYGPDGWSVLAWHDQWAHAETLPEAVAALKSRERINQ